MLSPVLLLDKGEKLDVDFVELSEEKLLKVLVLFKVN